MVPKIRVRQTKFLVILGHLLPFYPPNNPQNQNFEKMKKMTYHFTQMQSHHVWFLRY